MCSLQTRIPSVRGLTILRLRRRITGVPQGELAAAAGHTQAWYSRLERGLPGANLNAREAEKIARALGARPETLFAPVGGRRAA